MNKAIYDTRFFAEYYYSKDKSFLDKMRMQKAKKRYISAVVIHEFYNFVLSRKGRETAKAQISNIVREFEVIPVDAQIAQISAELRHKHQLPMGDSMIAATALMLKAVCITDDSHFKRIKEIETAWF